MFAAGAGRTRIGERLSPLPLDLYSDPNEPGLECEPFVVATGDAAAPVPDNGLSLTRTGWITRGELRTLVGHRRTGPDSGTTVAPRVGNLVLTGGTGASLADMVASTRRGILITALWYLRPVDPVRLQLTGLTRDGVHLIEDGRIRGVVPDFRVYTSPLTVLGQAREAGVTVPALPREYGHQDTRTAMPALRIPGLRRADAGVAA
ncbi:hypothetical protein HCA58_21840 [Micromonospora sp. HNM0581]|nr:hypothetical protein [Micromonospora sp. HNM0581]